MQHATYFLCFYFPWNVNWPPSSLRLHHAPPHATFMFIELISVHDCYAHIKKPLTPVLNLQLTACNVQHNISCFYFPPYPTACLIYAYNWRQCVTVMLSLKNLLLPHAFTTHSTQDASHTCKNSKPFFTIYGCGQKRQRGPFQLVAGSLFILCGWENQQEAAAERRGGGGGRGRVVLPI